QGLIDLSRTDGPPHRRHSEPCGMADAAAADGASRLIGYVALALFALTIPAANWLIGHVGVQFDPHGPHLIPVGFDLMAPSGVLMVGLAFTLRDIVQRELG